MRVNVNAISTKVNIPVCTSITDIQVATYEDAHLQETEGIYNARLATQEGRRKS